MFQTNSLEEKQKLVKQESYDQMCEDAHSCRRCSDVYHNLTYLNKGNGDINSPLMFIGEAPGFVRDPEERGIAFHGNQSGTNFEVLLASIGIPRDKVFVTNGLLHTPIAFSEKFYPGYGHIQIRPPKLMEQLNCMSFLRDQIRLVDPAIVCTLGRSALEAIRIIEPHRVTLAMAGKESLWFDRYLMPFFHTSPNVTAKIRTMTQMRNDFLLLKLFMLRIGIKFQKNEWIREEK